MGASHAKFYFKKRKRNSIMKTLSFEIENKFGLKKSMLYKSGSLNFTS